VNTTGISSEHLAKGIHDCTVVDGLQSAAETAVKIAKDGDIIITMGGGDIYKSAYIMRDILSE
jgi:UDP-N-acetylmuramate-alanine ligase